jgi:hypothetical protein
MEENRFKQAVYSYSGFSKHRPDERLRALRIPVRIPLRFRHRPDAEWVHGTIVNLSQSGLLYRSDRLMPVQTPVEITYTLPVEFGGKQNMEVFCKGEIVRSKIPASVEGQPLLAAKIMDYLPRL